MGIKAFVRFRLHSCSQALIILRRHSTAALNAQRIELRSGLRIIFAPDTLLFARQRHRELPYLQLLK